MKSINTTIAGGFLLRLLVLIPAPAFSAETTVSSTVGNSITVSASNTMNHPASTDSLIVIKWPEQITASVTYTTAANWEYISTSPDPTNAQFEGDQTTTLQIDVLFGTLAKNPDGTSEQTETLTVMLVMPIIDLSITNPDDEEVGKDEYNSDGGIVVMLPEMSMEDPVYSKIVIPEIDPSELGGNYHFTWDETKLEAFEDEKGEKAVLQNKDYNATQEWTFYVRGKDPSDEADDLTFKVNWLSSDKATTIVDADIINLTVIKVEMTVYGAGTKSKSGDKVKRPEKKEQKFIALLNPNDDDDDKRGSPVFPKQDNDDNSISNTDDDLLKVEFEFLPIGMNDGRLKIEFDTEKIQAFTESNSEVTAFDFELDLKSPQGLLADLKDKKVALFFEGLNTFIKPSDLKFSFKKQDTIREDKCLLSPLEIIPNFDRNETIEPLGGKDRGKVTKDKPWRWWINDDSDSGDIGGGDSDVPGALTGWFEWDGRDPNYSDSKVNGRCDLVDFFPLFFDLKQLLKELPPNASTQYKLKHEQDAFGFIYTDLTPEQADDFCVNAANTGYGPNFTQPAKDATVTQITSAGVALNTTFLDKIKEDGKGILLFEASKATNKPLVLEVTKDGQKIAEINFYIKTDGVENMYRWLNLRNAQGVGGGVKRSTNIGQPDNYPDNLTNEKYFILVHGYNVREHQARGWNAETFKRLHQLGSKAKFVGVAWLGDQGKISDWVLFFGGGAPDYYENAINAFETSPHLAAIVNNLRGEKYVAGHSLGNMLTTSAIQDHSMGVNKYFMIDAAVAMEAYDASLESNQNMRDRMRCVFWHNYSTRLWSTEWYKLFDQGDGRHDRLTWRGRFGNIVNAINFYSSSEDVLQNNPDGTNPPLDAAQGTLVWAKQEMEKGSGFIDLATWDSHGGWGFNLLWDNTTGYDLEKHEAITEHQPPEQANTLTDDQLRRNSFFKRFSDSRLYDTDQGSAAANEYYTHSKILAEAIPALSFAAGANSLDLFEDRNVDMMLLKTGKWPRENGQWRHSDFRDVAFFYTQKLYKRFIDEGGLKQ